jgi:glycosyltransferase involved in cell wall biosynthesis
MSRRVLMLLSQMPQDPSSGAALSMLTMCELLAARGFAVRILGTTATEHATPGDPYELLRGFGCDVTPLPIEHPTAGRADVLSFTRRDVDTLLLDVGPTDRRSWETQYGELFDRLLVREVEEYPPDILLTFGGSHVERERRRYVRSKGAAVVFALKNLSYFDRRAFHDVDVVMATSRFLSDKYRDAIGLESTPLLSPMQIDDVVAEKKDPRFLTFINPTPAKGVLVFARIAEELSARHPDMPIMVVESRAGADILVGAGMTGGVDLRARKNILVSPGVALPKHIYEVTRVLLVPSLWEEPQGRVPCEAILNGIPPVVSDRGGLPEATAALDQEGIAIDPPGGFVLPIPETITPKATTLPNADQVETWIETCETLMLHDGAWAEASLQAERNAWRFHPDRLGEQYAAFMESVQRVPGETAGPGLD